MPATHRRARRALLLLALLLLALPAVAQPAAPEGPVQPDPADIDAASRVLDLTLTQAERDSLQQDLAEQLDSFRRLRALVPDNAVAPAVRFDPLFWRPGAARELAAAAALPDADPVWELPAQVARPADPAELAWLSVGELAALLRAGEVTSVELTRLALARLEEHDPQLHCVITRLEDRALEHARRADREAAAGHWRGPLHGIPCGVKDLLAIPGHRTTWGATPYQDQQRPELATVCRKLEEAGAVIVAKLTLGALAWGDVWFGGMTRNPWNPEQGSSGSSAGSASAVAAGLVPFAIGTETWGSIVSPSTRCGVTGLRPTFGRVSRHGAMALSWTMDKIGPIARSAEDCAMVLEAIMGPDAHDPTVIAAPFRPHAAAADLASIRVGYVADLFEPVDQEPAIGDDDAGEDEAAGNADAAARALDRAVLDVLREAGCELIPVSLPERDPYPLGIILSAEAAAAFQDLTLSGRDDELVRQIRAAWPNVFRAAQFIPAVEYLQANRQRLLLMQDFDRVFTEVDVYVTPSFGGGGLLMTNLTGHPQLVVPSGFLPDGAPHSISFVGDLFGEAALVAVAREYQRRTAWDEARPPGF
jgi:Asp-tRNA(Asn)/Glu-tRNA(Gln) amidotransferase A subunit family amidase